MHNPGKNLKISVNVLTVSYNDKGSDDDPVIIFKGIQ